MASYAVALEITGTAYVYVEADSEECAKAKALEGEWVDEALPEWDMTGVVKDIKLNT